MKGGPNDDNKYIMGLNEVLLSPKRFKVDFPVTVKILKVAITLEILSATCERSFSCIRHIKLFLRFSLTTNRLSAMAILSTGKEFASSINFNEFLQIF